MAEGTYEYECMRAELLGVEKPDYDEFIKKQQEKQKREAEEETIDSENLKAAEDQSETLKSTTGKLDELNNILAATQKKIDGFKIRCGSVTELIKTKISGISGITGGLGQGVSEQEIEELEKEVCERPSQSAPQENGSASSGVSQRKSDLTRALDNNVDTLDSMVDKTDDIVSRMNDQNKRMKKLLNK